MNGGVNMVTDRDAIVRLYVEERLSLRMVADRTGYSIEGVRLILVARGIPRRVRGVTRHARNYKGAIERR